MLQPLNVFALQCCSCGLQKNEEHRAVGRTKLAVLTWCCTETQLLVLYRAGLDANADTMHIWGSSESCQKLKLFKLMHLGEIMP